MLTSAPKWHKLMPEIPNVRFSCGNSNMRDLLQILATEIQTNFNNSPWQNVPKLCWKVKKTCHQNRLKNTRCKGIHVIERPATPYPLSHGDLLESNELGWLILPQHRSNSSIKIHKVAVWSQVFVCFLREYSVWPVFVYIHVQRTTGWFYEIYKIIHFE
jgi:hypothetical protein